MSRGKHAFIPKEEIYRCTLVGRELQNIRQGWPLTYTCNLIWFVVC